MHMSVLHGFDWVLFAVACVCALLSLAFLLNIFGFIIRGVGMTFGFLVSRFIIIVLFALAAYALAVPVLGVVS